MVLDHWAQHAQSVKLSLLCSQLCCCTRTLLVKSLMKSTNMHVEPQLPPCLPSLRTGHKTSLAGRCYGYSCSKKNSRWRVQLPQGGHNDKVLPCP